MIMFGRTYGARLNSTRFKRCKGEEVEIILEQSCMVADDGNLFHVTCLSYKPKKGSQASYARDWHIKVKELFSDVLKTINKERMGNI